MEHVLEISTSRPPGGDPSRAGYIAHCKRVTVRERLLRFLLGDKLKLTVIVPGDSVKALHIIEERGGSV